MLSNLIESINYVVGFFTWALTIGISFWLFFLLCWVSDQSVKFNPSRYNLLGIPAIILAILGHTWMNVFWEAPARLRHHHIECELIYTAPGPAPVVDLTQICYQNPGLCD